ncbi:hypothetical protein PF008_g5223 [Phytophthora fragariae]|uniref:Uncharacterized protein n=1 Tax=Phytophthora fragariae TaxID=53985 RepID=A0A6G0S994_9STRA|nr:hypothetical protein PF008_g5223 [Phytophthora fragariae]
MTRTISDYGERSGDAIAVDTEDTKHSTGYNEDGSKYESDNRADEARHEHSRLANGEDAVDPAARLAKTIGTVTPGPEDAAASTTDTTDMTTTTDTTNTPLTTDTTNTPITTGTTTMRPPASPADTSAAPMTTSMAASDSGDAASSNEAAATDDGSVTGTPSRRLHDTDNYGAQGRCSDGTGCEKKKRGGGDPACDDSGNNSDATSCNDTTYSGDDASRTAHAEQQQR